MMKRSYIFLIAILLALPVSLKAQNKKKQPVDYVNPLIGTHNSRWMLFPGATMPFGMVKLSPDNQGQVWKGGYEYNIHSIGGFSHIHSWAMAGLLTMPVTGKLMTNPGDPQKPDSGFRSRFHHSTEVASPGYYAVTLDDYHIRAELTTTTHTGFERYTFPKADTARILFKLKFPAEYNFNVDWAAIRKVSNTEIVGFSKQKTFDGYSGLDNEYTVYFVAKFSKPFCSFGGWSGKRVLYHTYSIHGRGDVGAFLNYSTHKGEVIKVKTAISLVSIKQAELNLKKESGPFGWNFYATRKHARETWNKLLSSIKVQGGTKANKIKFYTNMYRSYCARTIWSDVNGKFVDPCEQIAKVKDPKSPVYGSDAFWNTFWNLNQLWELATPNIASNWVKSFLTIYDRGGWLPKGPTGIEYSGIMVASHEIDLINSAYQKGIRNFDVQKAYKAMKKMQTVPGRAYHCGGIVGDRQLKPYMKLGYVPYGPATRKFFFGDKDSGPVSNTLEYAFDDWNVAEMAKALGKKKDYQYFLKRAHNYLNVFNKKTDFIEPRKTNGDWIDAKSVYGDKISPESWLGTGFVEGNAWQYTWFYPQDMNGLVKLLGRKKFNDRLNKGFDESMKYNFNAPLDRYTKYPIDQGNETDMDLAYLFDFSGKPWLTQKWSREIMNRYYSITPEDGWLGDEDQGQMGAWFVMSAMGLFEVDGGGSIKPVYEIGSPIFPKITIRLDPRYYKGGKFVIEAQNVSNTNHYIQKAWLNGKPLKKTWIYHKQIVDGGILKLIMGPKPNKKWGSGRNDAPPSMSTVNQ